MSVWDDLSAGGNSTWGSQGAGGGGGFTGSQIQGGASALGLGISALGTYEASQSMNKAAGYQSQAYQGEENIAQLEIGVNNQRRQQMVLQTQRQQLENVRNVQRARAMGLTAATGQGAQFSSGFAGAQGSEASKGAYNALGISQNYQIGQNIFGLDDQISQQRIGISQAESNANTAMGSANQWKGIGSIGSSLAQAAPSLAMLAL